MKSVLVKRVQLMLEEMIKVNVNNGEVEGADLTQEQFN